HRPRRDGARAVLEEDAVHDETSGEAVDLEAVVHGVVEVAVLDGGRLVRRRPGLAPHVEVHPAARGVHVQLQRDLLAALRPLLDPIGELPTNALQGLLNAAHDATFLAASMTRSSDSRALSTARVLLVH